MSRVEQATFHLPNLPVGTVTFMLTDVEGSTGSCVTLLLASPTARSANGCSLPPETVKIHLSHIYAKLGIPSRSHLAAEATRRKLDDHHPLDPLPIGRARRALNEAGHDNADR